MLGNDTLKKQGQLVNQYTGNAGYQNALSQGLSGAAATANQAGSQAQTAARNSGMSKAQAAAMGANQAANAYGDNLANQQSMAGQFGNQALQANDNLYNRQYDRGKYNVQMIGNALQSGGSLLTGFLSDEKCKEFSDIPSKALESLDNIDAYLFKYNEQAQEEKGADDDLHVGVMAQELEKSPLTETSVKEQEDGTKVVDTNELTMAQMAMITEMWKEIQLLKAKMGDVE